MKERRIEKIIFLAALFILIFSMALRINAPRADLPSDITFSGSILTDEGNQCHNSRSKALYDEWFPDDWRITNYNPILPYIKLVVFRLFGVGMWQLRSVSFIFAFFSLLFFYLTLRSLYRPRYVPALLGTVFLGINFLYVMYNKIGTFETSITFWVILTIYFLEKYRVVEKSFFLVLTGASAFMAFVFKSIMAYFLPLPFIACILLCLFHGENNTFKPGKGVQQILFILAGILLISIPWYLFHYLPNKEWILSTPGKYMGRLMFPTSLESAVHNFLTFNWKDQFYKIPIIWLGAVLYIPFFLRRLINRKLQLTEATYALFFFAHTVVFFIMSYRPTRYFIPVIPAMIAMTIFLFTELALSRPEEKSRGGNINNGLLYTLDVLWLTIAAAFCFLPLISRYIYRFNIPPITLRYPVGAAIVIGIVYIVKYFYHKLVWKKPDLRFLYIPFIILAAAVSVYTDLSHYLKWNRDKVFTIRDISLELKEKLDNAYIAGMTAPVAVLENKHKALWLYPDFVNWDDKTFEKYPLTHALLGTDVSREIFHYFNTWPIRMGHAALLKVYHIKNYFLHLYSFVNPYIRDGKKEEENRFRLTVVNPSKKIINARIGRIALPTGGIEETGTSEFSIEKGEKEFPLQPGENIVTIESPVSNVFIFLEYAHPFANEVLRYEGEIFPGKTGEEKKELAASDHLVRFYDPAVNAPGFLSYGPAIPYGPGIMIVDFKLGFGNLKTKIRPICDLDIYSHEDNAPIAALQIRPGDIKKNETGLYRLHAILPATRTLEFRVRTTEYAEVSFDYIDITYYQGAFLPIP
jgi:hypothetical protein